MSEPYDADPMYCDVCKTALARYTASDGRVAGYQHQSELRGHGPAGHEPVVVPLATMTDAVMECDFCSRERAAWMYRTVEQIDQPRRVVSETVALGDYQTRHRAARVTGRRTEDAGGPVHWGERWSACVDCAAYIDKRDLYGLVGRVTEALPSKLTRGNRLVEVRGRLITTYEPLLANLAPTRGRITPKYPLGEWEEC